MFSRPLTIVIWGIIAFILLHIVGWFSGVEPPTQTHDKIAQAIAHNQYLFPANLERVVVFGDSLSDDGTGAWLFTNHTWPAHPAYVGHRFSNGMIYSEYLATALSLPMSSFAVGGASISHRLSSASGPNSSWPVDCIHDQIDKYALGKSSQRNTVFIMYAGANDLYFGLEEGGTVDDVLTDIKIAVRKIKQMGGRYILIPTLPPLGTQYPFAKALPKAAEQMGHYTEKLHGMLLDWVKTERSVEVADFYALFQHLMSHPLDYGFNPAKLSMGCIDKMVCPDVHEYIWFDNFHPTTVVHKMMGDVALEALDRLMGRAAAKAESIPARVKYARD
ncbi:lipolytic enzyme, G-D-S-L family [Meredithblackwellia eburnea MCA 4105]